VIGSFLNLSSLAEWLREENENILLVCAGWKNNFNLEDTVFAGAVVNKLKDEHYILDDSSIAAEDLYLLAKDDLDKFLSKSSHSDRLKKLGIEEDIAFCLRVDEVSAIPVLDGDRLVKL
jgi:2-phosphosulfolactate phosphatase